MTDPRVLMERDDATGIARITLNNPERRNCYDPAMRAAARRVSSTSSRSTTTSRSCCCAARAASSPPAPTWATRTAGTSRDGRRRRRRPRGGRASAAASSVDRKSFGFYHEFMGYPKATVAEVRGYALGGGFELALMADIAVVARDAQIGMPATRFLGPALGSLHLFFHRLGPVLARRLLLTGDTIPAVDGRAPRRVHRGRRRRRRRGRVRRGGRRRSRRCRPTAS